MSNNKYDLKKQLSWDKKFLQIADIMSEMSKCQSKKVCALAVKNLRIIGTGLNGSLPNQENCCDKFHTVTPENRHEHHEWSLKHEIHAEINLISEFAKSNQSSIGCTVYTNLEPCVNCARCLSRIGIKRIVFSRYYDMDNANTEYLKELMIKSKIELIHIGITS